MTFSQLRQEALRLMQEDLDNQAEFEPLLSDAINQGYRLIAQRLGQDPPPLAEDDDTPAFSPAEYHAILADYAAYVILGTGSSGRQNRAMFFYNRFLTLLPRVRSLAGQTPGPGGRPLTHRYRV